MSDSIGDELDPAATAQVGEAYHRTRKQQRIAREKRDNEVDATDRRDGRVKATKAELERTLGPGWSQQLLNEVRKRSDEELKRDALAILAYQTVGRYSHGRVATLMGQTPYWVKTTLRVAREKNLIDDVIAAARSEMEHEIVPDALRAAHALVKGKDPKVVLGVLQGVGVLKQDGSSDAPRAMALTVNIVNQAGVTTPQTIDPANIVGAPSVIVHQTPALPDPKP